MVEVVRIMTALSEMFSGELGPVEYSLSKFENCFIVNWKHALSFFHENEIIKMKIK